MKHSVHGVWGVHTVGIDGYQDGLETRGVVAPRVRARGAHARRHARFLAHVSFLLPTSGKYVWRIFGKYIEI